MNSIDRWMKAYIETHFSDVELKLLKSIMASEAFKKLDGAKKLDSIEKRVVKGDRFKDLYLKVKIYF
jgi:hypothetical protein